MTTAPYVFISYAHADGAQVIPLLEAMQAHGYRVWYDRDIVAGSEWSDDIADHLDGCAVCLGFVSDASVASENCRDELAFAKSRQKTVLLAFTDHGVQLSAGAEMQTARYQRLFLDDYATPADFVAALDGVPSLAACREEIAPPEPPEEVSEEPSAPRRSKWWLALLLSLPELFLGLIILLFVWKADRFTSAPAVPESSDVPTGMDARAEALLTDRVTLEGVTYTLPVPVRTLLDDGWAILEGAGAPSKLVYGQKADVTLLKKNKAQIVMYFYNPSGHAAETADCVAVRLSGGVKEIGAMLLGDGVDLRALSAAQLTDTYGPPATYAYDREKGEHTFFYGDGQTNAGVSVWYEDLNAAPKTLCIRANATPAETETDPQPPAYLDGYAPPEALGSDVVGGNFELDGKLYRLGVPLSVLRADGWTPKEGSPDCLLAGQELAAWLEKDGKALYVVLKNHSMRQTATDNGYVTAVAVPNATDAPALVLPGGLAIGTSRAQADALLGKLSVLDEDAQYIGYKTANGALTVLVDKASDGVCSVTLKAARILYD